MTPPNVAQDDAANRARISRNVDKMLSMGASEQEVEQYIQSEGLQPRQDFSDVQSGGSSTADVGMAEGLLRSAGQGLSLGFSDELQGMTAAGGPLGLLTQGGRERYAQTRDNERARGTAFTEDNPLASLSAEVVGGLPTAVLGGGAAVAGKLPMLARALRTGGIAAGAGAAAGAGHSEAESPLGVAGDAALGGAVAAPLGFGGSMAAEGASGLLGVFRDALNPRGAVIRQAAKVLPDDAEQLVQQQEALAPGTAVVGDLGKRMQRMAGKLHHDDATAAAAPGQLAGRTQDIGMAMEGMGPDYDALQQMLPIDQPLLDILARLNKAAPGAVGDDVDFLTLQKLRSGLRKTHRSIPPSMARHDLGEGIADLTSWLQQSIPEVGPLDARYGFLAGRQKAANVAAGLSELRSGNNAAIEAGGGNNRGFPGGLMGMVKDAFAPDKSARSREIQDVLFNPANTARVLPEIRAARTQLLAPPSAGPQILGGAAAAQTGATTGGTASSLSAWMAEQDTEEIRMRQQQQMMSTAAAPMP